MQLLLRLPGAKALLRRMNGVPHSAPIVELWDIPFKGYVGLAAGFDKDGTLLDNADCLGFSFMEVGTISPSRAIRSRAYSGFPRTMRSSTEWASIR